MTSRYEAKMNNVSLASLDDSILVLDIQPVPVAPQYKTIRTAGANGAIVRDPYYEKSSVNILFEIHEYDIADRMEICQSIQKWASAGILTTNDRDGQQLNAVCESFPTVNAKSWTEQLSMTLSGYKPPFWEDATATTQTVTVSGDEVSVGVPGNVAETLVSATVTASASISTMTFNVGEKTIILSGLSLSSGDVVELAYDNGILFIRKGYDSLISKVDDSSDDVLSAKCGESVTFDFTADGAASCEYSFRGCWL
jgi:hypothetical protein